MYKKIIKRLLDIVLSTLAIIVLAIPMLIIALIIKITDPGPAIFVQKRVGKNKVCFEMYKFRSMRTNAPKDVPTRMLNDSEQYITRIGRFLRKSSLDELPQIFNIWTGKMSIIGPRPVIENEDDLIAERDKYGANDVRPGLTGWAQINGRDEIDVCLKAKLDGEYVEKMSFAFDCKCFFGTIISVLRSDGVVEGGEEKPEKQEEKEEAATK